MDCSAALFSSSLVREWSDACFDVTVMLSSLFHSRSPRGGGRSVSVVMVFQLLDAGVTAEHILIGHRHSRLIFEGHQRLIGRAGCHLLTTGRSGTLEMVIGLVDVSGCSEVATGGDSACGSFVVA